MNHVVIEGAIVVTERLIAASLIFMMLAYLVVLRRSKKLQQLLVRVYGPSWELPVTAAAFLITLMLVLMVVVGVE